jgi:hypothetical protein
MNALIDSLSWKKCQEKSDGAFRNMEMFHDTLCRNSSDFAITVETAFEHVPSVPSAHENFKKCRSETVKE